MTFCFEYGSDKTSWYWKDQFRRTVGAGPVAQIVTLPNPQALDTLPATRRGGDLNKVASLQFNLFIRGVPIGADVTEFVLTIEEGVTPTGPEQPEYNAQGKVIQACKITEIWAGGVAEVWDVQPAYDQSSCVDGQRATEGTRTLWTFDLTAIAAEWAADPFLSNNGILFLPKTVGGPQENTYQVNLKLPTRDRTETAAVDEYETTKGRTVVTMTLAGWSTPPPTGPPTTFPPPAPQPPTFPPTTSSTTTSSTTQPVGGGGGGGGAPPPPIGGGDGDTGGGGGVDTGAPPGDTGGGDTITGGNDSAGGAGTDAGGGSGRQRIGQASGPVPTIKFPWYGWLLLPIGILALAAVRSILFEQAQAGIRPNGVIAAIRARNASARGAIGGGGVIARVRAMSREGQDPRPGGSK